MMMPIREGSFSSGLRFCRSKTSYTMGGFCLLYLPMILLMRSGDIETNPGPNHEGSVSEWELLQLAERIDPACYLRIGLSLGVRHAQLTGIMKQQLNDNTNALMAVFMTWNNRELPSVNKREVLADKLRQSGLVDLSNQIRNGNLDANLTEEPPRSLESQNQPLSPALIERCRNDFKFKYRSSLCKIRYDPLDPNSLVEFMYMYTNLVLKEEHHIGSRLERELLTYSELLNLIGDGERPRRLMVQGEAGVGKTTFCAKIAWDWINELNFKEFVWVLIVSLRECKRYTLGEIAKSYLTKSNPTTAHQLTEYIRSNPDKVFIACDGLDEFSGKIEQLSSECEQTQSVDQMQLQSMQSTSGTVLPRVGNSGACENPLQSCQIEMGDILCSEQLETCPVLVTSRPWRAKEIRSNGDLAKLYTFIHVEGFSEGDLSDYIHKFFPENDTRANRLIKLTKESDVISKNMAHYPIYVAILCLMWREISDQELEEMESFQTFSQVFRQMFRFLKGHFAQKKIKNVASQPFRDYLKEMNNLLEPVSSLALTGLLENKLVFDESDFQHCPKSMEIACRVGILSQENKISSMLDSDESSSSHLQTKVFVPHKLFQEYMAGMHLASICKSDCSEFKRLMETVVLPRGEEFRYLLYFAASQDKEVGINVMKCMVQGLDERTDLLVDVAYECNHPEAVAVVHEETPPKKQEMDIDSMTSHTIAAYQSIGIDAVKIRIVRLCSLNYSPDVARIICSSPSLQSLQIIGSFHEDFFKILKEQSANIQANTVSLFIIDTNNKGFPTSVSRSISHDFAETLGSMPHLHDLTLGGQTVHEEFYSALKEKAPSLKINTVTLGDICSTENGLQTSVSRSISHDLAETLCSLPHLHDLTLEGQAFHDEFYSILKEKAPSLKIQTFTMKVNLMLPLSCTTEDDLVEALSSMPELAKLTLDWWFLQDTFCKKLSQRASSYEGCFPQVTRDNFIFNGVRQRDMQAFLDTLQEQDVLSDDESSENLSEDEQDVLSDCLPPTCQKDLGSIGVPEGAQSTSTELPGVNDSGSIGVAEGAQSTSTQLHSVQDRSLKIKALCTQSSATSEEKHPRVGSSDQEAPSSECLDDYSSSDERTSLEANSLDCVPTDQGGLQNKFSMELKGLTSTSTQTHQISAAAATTDSSLSSTGEKDFDDVLKDIANETRTDERVDDLGKELGISIAKIGGYKVTNKGGSKYDGTLEMLRDWRKTQSSSTMRKTLRDALVKVCRIDLQEKHFPVVEGSVGARHKDVKK